MNVELFKRIISSFILIPIVIYVIYQGSYLFICMTLICLIISMYEWNKMTKYKTHKYLGLIFLIISFSLFYKLRIDYDFVYVLLVLIICITTDIGGFIFGNLFKGKKITKISPNKTYSGMFGSYILSVVFIYYFFNTSLIHSKNIIYTNEIFFFTISLSTVSQIGDIFISYFKRLSNIKDTGNLIPGHGGLLDRIDGMIFVFPTVYIFLILKIFHLF